MQINLDLNIFSIALIAVSAVITIFFVFFYRRTINRVSRKYASCQADETIGNDLPSLSVVVFSHGTADNLTNALHSILSQYYTSHFEVIVVADGRSEHIEDVVKVFSAVNKNIRFTYVPDDAHNLSRKKLALTLGIKAAKYDYVFLTDGEIATDSTDWLARMSRHFIEKRIGMVVGMSRLVNEEGEMSAAFSPQTFDYLMNNVEWLSAAIKRRTYRCSIVNMAFRKELFFNIRGFADSLNLHNGEDDIFVSNLAQKTNVEIEISSDAQIEYRCYDLKSTYTNLKINRLFTGKYVRRTTPLYFGLASASMWLWLFSLIASLTPSWPDIFPGLIILGLGLIWMILITLTWKKASKSLKIKCNAWLLPFNMFYHPFYNIRFKIKARFHRSRNFTWSRPLK